MSWRWLSLLLFRIRLNFYFKRQERMKWKGSVPKKNNQDTHKFIIGLSNLVRLNRRLPPPQLPPTTLRCRTSSTRTPARFPVAKYDSSEMSSATKFFNGTNFVRGTRHLKCDMDATPNAVSPLSCTNEIRLYRSFRKDLIRATIIDNSIKRG